MGFWKSLTCRTTLHAFPSKGAIPLSLLTSTRASKAIELTEHLPTIPNRHHQKLRTVLADFKSDLLSSITTEPPAKGRGGLDFIHKQLSGNGIAATPIHSAEKGIGVAPHGSLRVTSMDGSRRGPISMGIITAISLTALWGVTTNLLHRVRA